MALFSEESPFCSNSRGACNLLVFTFVSVFVRYQLFLDAIGFHSRDHRLRSRSLHFLCLTPTWNGHETTTRTRTQKKTKIPSIFGIIVFLLIAE